ncbi:MAG: hypothetical protein GY696_04180, partial [Gammaproteobacteria bacterium]|nr:hypothetical protein [Gammaproteobacteria bacterium]
MRRKILHKAHIGHPGMVRMKRLLHQPYWWPGIDKQVERLVKQCEACQRSAKSRPALSKESTPIPAPEKPAVQYA